MKVYLISMSIFLSTNAFAGIYGIISNGYNSISKKNINLSQKIQCSGEILSLKHIYTQVEDYYETEDLSVDVDKELTQIRVEFKVNKNNLCKGLIFEGDDLYLAMDYQQKIGSKVHEECCFEQNNGKIILICK